MHSLILIVFLYGFLLLTSAEENPLASILENYYRVIGNDSVTLENSTLTTSSRIDFCINQFRNKTLNIICTAEKDRKECKGPPNARKVSFESSLLTVYNFETFISNRLG